MSTERRLDVELRLERWTDLPAHGWHPGNTHLHYDDNEVRPDERLRFDSVVEGYGVTVISILMRREIPYASNRYPIGLFTDLSTAHHIVDVGEESRHNLPTREMDYGSFGYGHVMFIDIKNLVDPVSRGMLRNDLDPDFPPLCWACDDARDQGGTVIWCHNGRGMEAPVAAALGKIHAFNLFDAYWMATEYKIYYEMSNAGLRLPASTGSSWRWGEPAASLSSSRDVATGGIPRPLALRERDRVEGGAALMKPEAFLTNPSRGGLVDEAELYEALTGGFHRRRGA